MKYFGVSNSYIKARATCSKTYEYREVSSESLAFDCMRHMDLISRYEEGKDLKKSFYFVFSKFFSGRDKRTINEKIKNYISFYEKIKRGGYRDDIQGFKDLVITDNGIRLDGSHRAAIACFLGIKSLRVKYIKWNLLYYVLCRERTKKEFYYERFRNKEVYKDGVYLGKVLYTDWVPIKKAGLLLGRIYHILDSMQIIEDDQCQLT